MTTSTGSLAELFWEQGFLHLVNFFDEGDIANCTFALQKANELHGQPKWNHWAELEAVQAMILSSKVLSLAKDILGETPVFFGRVLETFEAEPLRQHHPVGHSSFQGLTKSVPRFLHIDAKGTEERLFTKRTGILEDRYPVIRFSHYFQDHSRYSYGIKLAPGSHRDGNPQNVQSLQNPPVKPCDLLIFNLKTVHAAKCLRHRSGNVLTPSQEDILEATAPHEFFPAPVTRNVLFWDFCTMSRVSELFIRNRAFSELSSWHLLGVQLDQIPRLHNLADRGELIVRYDTETSRLMALDLLGKLSIADRQRLHHLERISPCVVPLADDVKQFQTEILQAIEKSGLDS